MTKTKPGSLAALWKGGWLCALWSGLLEVLSEDIEQLLLLQPALQPVHPAGFLQGRHSEFAQRSPLHHVILNFQLVPHWLRP